MASMDDIQDRADELYESGEYDSHRDAWLAAYREALEEHNREHRAFVDSLPEDY